MNQLNPLVSYAGDFLKPTLLTQLDGIDLANLAATCSELYFVIVNDKNCVDKIFFQWSGKQFIYVNRGFLNPEDVAKMHKEKLYKYGSFSLQTVLLAAKWLKENGNTAIPPHGLGIFQPRSLCPADYINGTNMGGRFFHGLHYHLWIVMDSPMNIDDEYGRKAFSHVGGFQSTDEQKGLACEAYVKDRFIYRADDAHKL